MKFENDEDGYPTDKTLRDVSKYSGSLLEFFRDLKAAWRYGQCGVLESRVRDNLGRSVVRFRLHTWGWSGNENLVGAMQRNLFLNMFAWVESRVGGHYIYEFKRDAAIPEPLKRKRPKP